MKITRWRLAIAVVALTMVGASAAVATDVFADVDDDRFYSEPAEWAADNGITVGCGNGNFCPDNPVTRGENITFAKRYDDNIVQPALSTIDGRLDDAESDIADNAAAIAEGPTIYRAWVGGSGTPLGVSEGVSSTRTETGSYTVTFPEGVTQCTWQVSRRASTAITLFDPASTVRPEFSLVTRRTGAVGPLFPTDIVVSVANESGDPANSPFDLTVICP